MSNQRRIARAALALTALLAPRAARAGASFEQATETSWSDALESGDTIVDGAGPTQGGAAAVLVVSRPEAGSKRAWRVLGRDGSVREIPITRAATRPVFSEDGQTVAVATYDAPLDGDDEQLVNCTIYVHARAADPLGGADAQGWARAHFDACTAPRVAPGGDWAVAVANRGQWSIRSSLDAFVGGKLLASRPTWLAFAARGRRLAYVAPCEDARAARCAKVHYVDADRQVEMPPWGPYSEVSELLLPDVADAPLMVVYRALDGAAMGLRTSLADAAFEAYDVHSLAYAAATGQWGFTYRLDRTGAEHVFVAQGPAWSAPAQPDTSAAYSDALGPVFTPDGARVLVAAASPSGGWTFERRGARNANVACVECTFDSIDDVQTSNPETGYWGVRGSRYDASAGGARQLLAIFKDGALVTKAGTFTDVQGPVIPPGGAFYGYVSTNDGARSYLVVDDRYGAFDRPGVAHGSPLALFTRPPPGPASKVRAWTAAMDTWVAAIDGRLWVNRQDVTEPASVGDASYYGAMPAPGASVQWFHGGEGSGSVLTLTQRWYFDDWIAATPAAPIAGACGAASTDVDFNARLGRSDRRIRLYFDELALPPSTNVQILGVHWTDVPALRGPGWFDPPPWADGKLRLRFPRGTCAWAVTRFEYLPD